MVPAREFLLAFKNLMNEEKKNVERLYVYWWDD